MCWGLRFFDSGEWQVLDERLWELQEKGSAVNPERGNLFASLDAVPLESVKVAILGQDPYPTKGFATGIAFDIPPGVTAFPPTLINIFKEYCEDLGLPFPSSGSLLPWCKQGVLLYNVIPTCYTGLPASHRDWTEWTYLTQEVLEKVNGQGAVVVSLGSLAKSYCNDVPPERFLNFSHPSPLSALKGNRPFSKSRFFSTINAKLVELGKDPIDWRLP